MRLNSIRIQNYKTLKNVELLNLNDFGIIIGQNMSGKSNFFEALRLLHNSVDQILAEYFREKVSFRDVVWRNRTTENIVFQIQIEIDETQRIKLLQKAIGDIQHESQKRIYDSPFLRFLYYEVTLNMSENPNYSEVLKTDNLDGIDRQVIFISKILQRDSQNVITNVNNIHDNLHNVLKGQVFDNNLSGKGDPYPFHNLRLFFYRDRNVRSAKLDDEIIKMISDFFTKFRFLGPNRSIKDFSKTSGTKNIAFDANNLAEVVNAIRNNELTQFDTLQQHTSELIPYIEHLLTPVSQGDTTIGIHEKGQESSIIYSLKNISAGTKNLLALLTFLYTAEERSVLFIEEPENNLHTSALRLLCNIFKDQSKNKQIIVTTHSPTTLLNFEIDRIYLCQRNSDGNSEINKITPDSAFLIVEELGISPSDFLDYDLIIFVEGAFDEEIYSIFANKMKLPVNNICFVNTEGSNNMRYYANASVLLKKRIPTKIILIFDGDTETNEKQKREKGKMLSRITINEENIFTLSKKELECYLLDVEVWFKAFQNLSISRDDIQQRFNDIEKHNKPRKAMGKLLEDIGIGSYTRDIARKLAESFNEIPPEIKTIFEHAKKLIGRAK